MAYTSTASQTTTTSSGSNSLPVGAIGGIVGGVGMVSVVLIVAFVFYKMRFRSRPPPKPMIEIGAPQEMSESELQWVQREYRSPSVYGGRLNSESY
jgi:hypothetical protein